MHRRNPSPRRVPGRRPRVLHVATVDTTIRFMLLGQLTALANAGYDVAAMSSPGPWRDDIESAGVRFLPWRHATRRWAPGEDAGAFRELHRTLRREGFDIVHTHNPKPGLIGRVAARIAGVPGIVHTTHGMYSPPDDGWNPRRLILGLEWLASRCSDFELYQSAEDLERSRRLGVVDRRCSGYLGNGIDLSRFEPARVPRAEIEALRARWGIPEGSLVVGMVGRLVREKGWRDFFEAARIVTARRSDVVFIAVGPADDQKGDSLMKSDVAAADGVVRFCGMTLEMPAALELMDVFVLASYREGFPRAAIEAAAMGKPLVLTDIRGCREVVTDGDNGILVGVRRPDELAHAIEQLLAQPTLRLRFGKASMRRARREFDERLVVQRTLAVYDALLDGRRLDGESRARILASA